MSGIIDSSYEIIGKLGAGGGGVVYLANHLRLGKKVVLKADKRNIGTREDLLRREVDVLKELNFTYIPQVYDYFVEDGVSYTVMDFVDGESLDKLLKKEGKFPQPTVIRWARQLLEALSYLHSPTHGDPPRGYVHSDVKPANIMLRPNGDICLIDFNIALAIGIETVVGRSEGYSSPEHYGIDYSFSARYDDEKTAVKDEKTELAAADEKTELATGIGGRSEAAPRSESGLRNTYSSMKKVVVPDARSDIYSVGATLYHLLSGKRPAGNAKAVEPLPRGEISPLLADIVTKAMNPNPDLRFASADEMLEALNGLWKNDPRVRRRKKRIAVSAALLSVMFIAGGSASAAGLVQTERLKTAQVLAASSSETLLRGDARGAADIALSALIDDAGAFDIPYTAEAQLALTNALGVYDLSDSFKPYETIELPSAPFRVLKSPDGTKLAVCYAYELAVYDIETGKLIKALPTLDSALCEAEFIGGDKILYAGSEGLTAYDISADTVIWQGEPATAVAVSGDGSVAAAVNGTENKIRFYDVQTGELISVRGLDGKSLNIPVNDKFADSGRDVFELNGDGSVCAVSLTGGYLGLLDIYNIFNDLIIYESSDYTAFGGGFIDNVFAYSAAGGSGSVFEMIDFQNDLSLGSIEGSGVFGVTVYGGKFYVTQNDTAVSIDPSTLEQTEAAYTENKNITAFDISDSFAISAANDGFSVFYRGAGVLQTVPREPGPDFVLMTDTYAVLADRSSPTVEVLKLENSRGTSVIKYDPAITHSEARLNADRSGALLFGIDGITAVTADGSIKASAAFEEPQQIYDQQYRHDNDCLEVTYYSGKVEVYDANTCKLVSETEIPAPDDSLDEEFETESCIVKAPLHGTPTVYDKKTGREVAKLNSEDYLTYITETDGYIIAQYISADGERYGMLMNKSFQPIARLPRLCDVSGDLLVFDLPSGEIKTSPIYELDELKEMASTYWD